MRASRRGDAVHDADYAVGRKAFVDGLAFDIDATLAWRQGWFAADMERDHQDIEDEPLIIIEGAGPAS